ncbi:heat shock 70 kDa protein 12B-like [Mytilus trossulus]|uniref:heat shock 70 kDa protein 12B-like n=1 Tax=Mytilus trossulus TaxID=6551 RepID=UPI0030062E3D
MKPFYVAAIDFGTTFTGYASMSRNVFLSETKTIEGKEWHTDRWIRHKTPTSILFDESQLFHSFGYEAEMFYSDNIGSNTINLDNWHFFQNVKSDISEKQDHLLDDQFMLYDIRKKNRMEGIIVISEIIRYLKEDFLKILNQRLPDFDNHLVHWILTVPVIWDSTTRGFIRKAAIMAGIPSHKQTIILEPDAAAFYCDTKEVVISQGTDGCMSLQQMPLGVKYLVVDLGGGTIDITVHKKEQKRNDSYQKKALGLKWGGKKVNDCFEEYCSSEFKRFTAFKRKHPDDYLHLMENFEQEKMQFNVDKMNKRGNVKVGLPASFPKVDTTKLSITSDIFRSFYDTPINGLIEKLNQLLQSDVNEMQDIKLILVVGGFAESSIVINELKKNFRNFDIVVPEKPGLAVMHGAVLFGFLRDLEDNNVNLTERTPRRNTERQANSSRHRSRSDGKKVKHFLSDIVGREIIKAMRKEQLTQLVGQFQDKISKFKNEHVERDKVIVTLPIELRDLYKNKNNKTLEDGLTTFTDDVSCRRDKLIITSSFFRKSFL